MSDPKQIEPDEDHRLANALARKYMNLEALPQEMLGEGRVVIRVTPQALRTSGPAGSRTTCA